MGKCNIPKTLPCRRGIFLPFFLGLLVFFPRGDSPLFFDFLVPPTLLEDNGKKDIVEEETKGKGDGAIEALVALAIAKVVDQDHRVDSALLLIHFDLNWMKDGI